MLLCCNLLERYRPTDVLLGNHDWRIFDLARHHNAVLAYAASQARNEFLEACRKVGAKLVDHYDINRSWLELGDTKFLHGFGLGGEMAIRDHAEHFGRCVIAHMHRAESAGARRSDHAVAYCVWTLANIPMMEYAKTRRSMGVRAHLLRRQSDAPEVLPEGETVKPKIRWCYRTVSLGIPPK